MNKLEFSKELNKYRGLFALLIVIGHTSMTYKQELLPLLLIHKFNMIGVCFFLFISAFSMAINFEEKSNYLHGFLIKKVGILYLLCLIFHGLEKLIYLIFLKEEPIIDLNFFVDWNWYIIEAIVYYIVFFLIYRFVNRKLIREILFILAAALICLVSLHFLKVGSWSGWTKSFYFSAFSFPLGIILCDYYETFFALAKKHPIRLLLILILIAALNCYSLKLPDSSILGGIIMRNALGISIILAFTIVIYHFDIRKIPFLDNLMIWTSNISTEMYLYHFTLMSLIGTLLTDQDFEINLSYTILVVGFTLLLSFLVSIPDRAIAKGIKKLLTPPTQKFL